MTPARVKELRALADLRQEDVAQLMGVSVATAARWENPSRTLPSGLPGQLFEVMEQLARTGADLAPLRRHLQFGGAVGAVRWLLNEFYQNQEVAG